MFPTPILDLGVRENVFTLKAVAEKGHLGSLACWWGWSWSLCSHHPFVLPALRRYCLPYVPATPIQIEKILLQLRGRPGKIVDLGSGDGRVVSTWLRAVEHLFTRLLIGHSCSEGGSLCSWVRVELMARDVFENQSPAFWSIWKTEFHRKDLWKVCVLAYACIQLLHVTAYLCSINYTG